MDRVPLILRPDINRPSQADRDRTLREGILHKPSNFLTSALPKARTHANLTTASRQPSPPRDRRGGSQERESRAHSRLRNMMSGNWLRGLSRNHTPANAGGSIVPGLPTRPRGRAGKRYDTVDRDDGTWIPTPANGVLPQNATLQRQNYPMTGGKHDMATYPSSGLLENDENNIMDAINEWYPAPPDKCANLHMYCEPSRVLIIKAWMKDCHGYKCEGYED